MLSWPRKAKNRSVLYVHPPPQSTNLLQLSNPRSFQPPTAPNMMHRSRTQVSDPHSIHLPFMIKRLSCAVPLLRYAACTLTGNYRSRSIDKLLHLRNEAHICIRLRNGIFNSTFRYTSGALTGDYRSRSIDELLYLRDKADVCIWFRDGGFIVLPWKDGCEG